MSSMPIEEAPLDTSLAYYMEQRALEIALSKATTEAARETVKRLMALRDDLLARRAAHADHMQQKRLERGEIYSDGKVEAINAMAPGKDELDRNVRACYLREKDAVDVLKAHARTEFGFGLASQRSLLAYLPDDVQDAARHMLKLEEAFAAEWVAAVADPAFSAEVTNLRREAALMLRTSNTPMYLESFPPCPQSGEMDAATLGKAWNRLDALAHTLGIQPLSAFVGIDGQAPDDSTPAEAVQIIVNALLDALSDSKHKIPAKKATREALAQLSDALAWLQSRAGRVYFAIDI